MQNSHTTDHRLTKEDLKFLKSSKHNIVCRFNPNYMGKNDSEKLPYVMEVLGNKFGTTDCDYDNRYIIPCSGNAYSYMGRKVLYAVTSLMRFKHVNSFIDQLKVGDKIKLEFHGNNASDYTTKAELYNDMLFMTIQRPLKNGKEKEIEFLMQISTCPNNTARMVKDELTEKSAILDY